jgi:hypothetical protein
MTSTTWMKRANKAHTHTHTHTQKGGGRAESSSPCAGARGRPCSCLPHLLLRRRRPQGSPWRNAAVGPGRRDRQSGAGQGREARRCPGACAVCVCCSRRLGAGGAAGQGLAHRDTDARRPVPAEAARRRSKVSEDVGD